MKFSDAMYEFCKQENLNNNEGSTGVKNLCRLLHAMGYRDVMHYGQFHEAGAYGDLFYFLEDNPGCIEAIKNWIAEQDSDDWKDELEAHLEAELCPECGKPLETFMKDMGDGNLEEVIGCPDCDS